MHQPGPHAEPNRRTIAPVRRHCGAILHNLQAGLLVGAALLAWVSAARAFDATLDSGDAKLHVYVEDARFELPYGRIVAWVQRSSDVVSDYFGGFPVEEAYVAVTGQPGKGVMNGIALGSGEAVVNVKLGLDTDERDLSNDWVLVHELIHLAFPKVHTRHHWAEEGLAVYVESVARVQAGMIDAETLWMHFVDGMPNGLPQEGDRGLDNTPTWGRTYWGGALFYLLADIEIIRRTGGDKTLKNGLRAIVGEGYSIRDSLEIRHIYRIADRATGVPVLLETYESMADRPASVDLVLLWRRLGVERTVSGVVFHENAEWAGVRTKISAGKNAKNMAKFSKNAISISQRRRNLVMGNDGDRIERAVAIYPGTR